MSICRESVSSTESLWKCIGAIIIRRIFTQDIGDHKAEFNIQSLEVLQGHLPPKATSLVAEWAALHQNELLTQWQRARKHEPLERIAPLE